MTAEYLKAILQQEKLKSEQLEEECGLITSLLLRKHYRNISETQFCSSMRRKQVGPNLRKYKSDSFTIDDKYNVTLSVKRVESLANNSSSSELPESKRMKTEEESSTMIAEGVETHTEQKCTEELLKSDEISSPTPNDAQMA